MRASSCFPASADATGEAVERAARKAVMEASLDSCVCVRLLVSRREKIKYLPF